MSFFKWTGLIFFTFLLQTQFPPFGKTLSLSTALVYLFGLRSLPSGFSVGRSDGYYSGRAEVKSTAFGAGVGLLEDIISGSIIGPGVFSKGLIGLFSVVVFTDVIFKWTPLIGVVIIIILTIADGSIIVGLRVFLDNININIFNVFQAIFIQTAFNMPFGIILKPKND